MKNITEDLLNSINSKYNLGLECPQNNKNHVYNVLQHTVHAVEYYEENVRYTDTTVCIAILLHDIGKPVCKSIDKNDQCHFYGHAKVSAELANAILADTMLPSLEIKFICDLILCHDDGFESTSVTEAIAFWQRTAGCKAADAFKRALIIVKFCDIMAQSEYNRLEKLTPVLEYSWTNGREICMWY